MADHLVICSLVLILFQKFCGTGKGYLRDVFFHLIRIHTDAIINELQALFFRIYNHINFCLIVIRELVFSHNFQFFQLSNSITAIGYHLSEKNIMV